MRRPLLGAWCAATLLGACGGSDRATRAGSAGSSARPATPASSAAAATRVDSAWVAESLLVADSVARDSARRYTPDASWGDFRSDRWGLALRYPPSLRLEIVGPRSAACEGACAPPYDDLRDSVVERAPDAGRASGRGVVRLRFVRAPLDSIAVAYGFSHDAEGWHTVGRQGLTERADHDATPEWDRLEGDALVGVEAPGGGMALDEQYRMLMVYRRSDGCSVVVSFHPAPGDGAEVEARRFDDFRRAAASMRFASPSH